MKKNLLLLLLSFSFYCLNAQITVTENSNATTLAQYLAGAGVTISNATLVCPTSTAGVDFSGLFTNADPSLGIPDGVILSTGEVTDIQDATGSTTFISESANAAGDTDLDALLTSLGETYTTNDACVLEFDIDVVGDTLRFNYAMGSEEYPTFVCGSVNDIFGFFISGPDPAGGTYVNQNIALIPGTTLPVSINTVNNGGSGSAATCYDGTYSNFMNANTTPISAVPNIAFNEVTKVLQAKAATVPCAQYHFKLAIADGGDWVYDSGVFLEAGSFSSTGVIVAASTILGPGFSTMVESCIDGEIEFILEDGVNNTGVPIEIPYTFSGSATPLVDFYHIPFGTSAFVQPGDSSTTIQLFALPDLINEGIETIEVNVLGPCGYIIASTMDIADIIPFTVAPFDDSLCVGETIDFEVTGAQTYSWSPTTGVSNPSSGTTTLSPAVTTTYTVSYSLGSCMDDSTFTVYVSNLSANTVSTNETCPDDNDGTAYFTYTGGVGNVSYIWDDGNTDSLRTNLTAGTYCVYIVDEGGCEITLCETITEPNLFISISSFPNTICKDDSANINVFSNLTAAATYSWTPAGMVVDPTSGTFTSSIGLTTQTTFTLTATDQGCTISDDLTIFVADLEASINVTDVTCPGDTDGSLEVVTTGENGGPFYFWDGGQTTSTISNLGEGNYCVEVSDFNCVLDICADVSSDAPLSLNLTADDTVLCNETSTNIYINDNITNGTYTWSPTANFANTGLADQNTAINLLGNTMIYVTASNQNNCVTEDSILIAAKTLVVNPDYNDITVGSGEVTNIGVEVVSQNNLNEAISHDWSPASFLASTTSENTTTTPTENIVYTITSEADGCIDIDSIMVFVGIEFEMPDAFTPNNDDLNERFYPVISGGEVLEFRVYNRWGDMVHDDPKTGWDGLFNGQKQITDVYNYFIKVTNGNEEITKLGNVTLLR